MGQHPDACARGSRCGEYHRLCDKHSSCRQAVDGCAVTRCVWMLTFQAQVAITGNPALNHLPTTPSLHNIPMSPLQENDALPDESVVASDPGETDLRTEEFLGLLAGFPIALQHHLLGTRALPQPPLCDLLPADYLSSLKRTDSRVRFAEEHSGPSGSGNPIGKSTKPNGDANTNGAAPGTVTHSDEESDGKEEPTGKEEAPAPVKKSNLHAPYPAHLPLSLLRLLEAYVAGFSQRPAEKGGWTPLQTERAIDAIKGLNAALTEAESIYNGEFHLPLIVKLTAAPDPVVSLTLCAYLFVLSILCFIALYMPPLVSLMTFGLIAAAFPPAFSRATTGPSPSCELPHVVTANSQPRRTP